MTPKVSVIVPIYNQELFIRETVDSVLSQDFKNVELVLSDDGSTDGTSVILPEYEAQDPQRVTVVASEHNTGTAGAFNRALDADTGEYIAWLGGDDVMLPGKLSRQVAVLEARPDVIGCCHDAEVFDSASGRSYGLFTEVYNGRRGVRDGGIELLLDPTYLMLPSTMMVRSAAVGRLRFDPRVRFSNDWLFDIQLFRHGQIAGPTTCLPATAATIAMSPRGARTRSKTRSWSWRWRRPATQSFTGSFDAVGSPQSSSRRASECASVTSARRCVTLGPLSAREVS
jgi:glycosyltransferase involved in cell wall biosynthesis